MYSKAGEQVIEEYGSLFDGFMQISKEKVIPAHINIDPKIKKELLNVILEKIKPPQISVDYIFNITSFESDGIVKIKEVLIKTQDLSKSKNYNIKMTYLGAPRYNMKIKAENYKIAEGIVQEIAKNIEKEITKSNSQVTWQKKS